MNKKKRIEELEERVEQLESQIEMLEQRPSMWFWSSAQQWDLPTLSEPPSVYGEPQVNFSFPMTAVGTMED